MAIVTSGNVEDAARARAHFYAPLIAFDRAVPKISATVFTGERHRAFADETPSGFVVLDRSAELGTTWPATTPTLLARYLVLRPGEQFDSHLHSSGEVYYVLRGEGRTVTAGESVDWRSGDVFCNGGGEDSEHVADSRAVLLVITDEPALSYLRVRPAQSGPDSIKPTLFDAARTQAHLDEVHSRSGEQKAAGKSVIFLTDLMAERRVTTPTILASINTLEPGGDQRAHRHSSVALTLSISGDGVYSMVDGERIDWEPDTVIVTPPGVVHSHHNRGSAMMRSFVVQDTALHTELRTTNFSWME